MKRFGAAGGGAGIGSGAFAARGKVDLTTDAKNRARQNKAQRLKRIRPCAEEKFGAASGVRTHDIRCHRAAFCH